MASGARDGRRPLRVPPPDLEHARCSEPGEAFSSSDFDDDTHVVAGPRGGPRSRLLRRRTRPACSRPARASSPTRRTCTRTAATRRRTSRSASSSRRRASSRRSSARPSRSATAWTSTSRRCRRTRQTARLRGAERATKILSFEPHLHAPGNADVPRGDLGLQHPDAQLRRLRPQLGARLQLRRRLRAALPKGAILHIIGYMDNTPANKNVPDPRNWSGRGNRSVTNMFIDLGNRVSMTDEQFQEEMAKRREKLKLTREQRRHRLPAVQHHAAGTRRSARSSRASSRTPAITRKQERDSMTPVSRSAGLAGADAAPWCSRRSPARHGAVVTVVLEGPDRPAGLRRLGGDAGRFALVRLRLHEPQLGGGDRRPDRSRQQRSTSARRPGAADALSPASQPLHVPRPGAEEFHREGRADLDAHDPGAHREGLRDAAGRLQDGRHRSSRRKPARSAPARAVRRSARTSRRSSPSRVPKAITTKVGQPIELVRSSRTTAFRSAACVRPRRGGGRRAPRRDATPIGADRRRPTRTRRCASIGRWRRRPASRSARTSGCTMSWFVYRGSGQVTFDPEQPMVWEDTRAGANSPWAPIWAPPEMPAGRQGDGARDLRRARHLRPALPCRRRCADGRR